MANAPKPAEAPRLSEADARELVMQSEALRAQMASLEARRDMLLELSGEARRALSTLEHAAQAKEGDEILIPLGAGTFLGGRLAHGGKAITSLGSGVHAEIPVDEAHARMKERVDSLEGAVAAVGRDIARVADEVARLNAVAEQFYG